MANTFSATLTRAALSAAALCVGVSCPVDLASSQESFYRGRDVNLYVGTTSGGGFDLYGRLVARHLGKHIAGEPSVVVRNMAGAGGIVQVNYMLGPATRDGTSIAIMNPTMTTAPFLQPAAAKWDSRDFVWLGSANQEISTCAFWPGSGVRELSDLTGAKSEVIVAGLGPATGSTIDAMTLRSVLGWKWKIVPGYPGLADAMKAAESGEVHGVCGVAVSTLKARLWDRFLSGDVRVMVQTSLRNHPDLPKVANAFDLTDKADDKQVMELIFGPWLYGRPFITTPDAPAERVEILRKALKETLADPQLTAEANKINLEIHYAPPEEISALVKRMYEIPAQVRERARVLIGG